MISRKQLLRVCALGAILLSLVGSAAAQTNTAYGTGALENNTSGYWDSAFGYYSLFNNTIGYGNTASGYAALQYNTTGSWNTAIGTGALSGPSSQDYTTGSYNIGVGYAAGTNIITGTNNIEIEIGAAPGSSDESNTIRLGHQGTQKYTYIAGIYGTAIKGADVVVSSSGRLGVLPSSVRYKKDIQPLNNRSRGLWQLRPVTFRYKQDPQERQYGLIAEEVARVYPELVVRGDKGEIESVQYHELIPLMLNEMQHQQAALATLTAQNAALMARLERLERTSKTLASR
jgi:Chaperone of endosialidase